MLSEDQLVSLYHKLQDADVPEGVARFLVNASDSHADTIEQNLTAPSEALYLADLVVWIA